MAMPEGSSQGASGHRFSTDSFLRSITVDSSLVFDVDEDASRAVADGELGLAVEGDRARHAAGAASITVALWPRPLKAKTRL